jgi:sterol desaturase/sphingolipid hydroxylase (fatty acid hydroxylase superfamily)
MGNMNNTQLLLSIATLLIGLSLYALERRRPVHVQKSSIGWVVTSLVFIVALLLVNRLGEWFWNPVFANVSLLSASTNLSTWGAVAVGYLGFSLLFYVTHRLKHRFDFLWRTLHQIHHSPQRIEVLTSFYAHPLEVLLGAVILSFSSFFVLGLDVAAAQWVAFLVGVETMLIHSNVALPKWVGYFIQHPSVHRAHHEAGVHARNYGLPILDRLFGTYYQPQEPVTRCGFESQAEPQLTQMLVFKLETRT